MGRSYNEEANLSLSRYFNEGYFSRKQFDTLITQIIAVSNLKPLNVLEIGPGNGFVSDFIKKSGIKVTTFDINEKLKPDVVGNLVEIDKYFEPDSFDLILCAEVLEHLPFSKFETIIKKLSLITKKDLVISLPRMHKAFFDFRLFLQVPFLKPIQVNSFIHYAEKSNIIKRLLVKMRYYFSVPNRKMLWEGHHWELDFSKNYSMHKILEILKKYFIIEKYFLDETNREHQFFILKIKINSNVDYYLDS